MSEISFYEEDRPVPVFIDEEFLGVKLNEISTGYGSEIDTLTYIFCSDDYLLDINKEHLNHDYFTDIITFPYQQGKKIEGDIFISVDRVLENAEVLGVSEKEEMFRVISHGLLHLIGFKDKTEEDEVEMRAAEDKAIKLILAN
jgi:probable rRNA maturation factor